MKKKLLVFLLGTLLIPSLSVAQKELGYPLSETFLPKQYKGSTQNWAICENEDGLIYVGNRDGLLEFDGVNWRRILAVGEYVVRSLLKGADGHVYLGKTNDFGYLIEDSIQAVGFQSLTHLLPDSVRNYQDIWSIQELGDKIYFQAAKWLFIYDVKLETIQFIKVNIGRADRSFVFKENYYINTTNSASEPILCQLKGDTFEVINEALGKSRWLIPYKGNKALFSSDDYPLVIYDFQHNILEALPEHFNGVLQEIKQSLPYHLISLDSQTVSIATLKGGVFQLNLQTGYVKRLNTGTGLYSNGVLFQYLDQLGNLWLAQDEAITCLRYFEPL